MKNTVLLIGALVTLATSGVARSQAPSTAPSAAPGPAMLPGDGPPPPLDAMLRPPGHHPTGPGGPPADSTPAPPLALAIQAAQTAVAACAKDGLRIGAVVTDATGHMRVGLLADGAEPGRLYFANRKALAAIGFREPTSVVQARLRTDPSAAAFVKPNMVVIPGAVPLLVAGQLLGAVGASGATGAQDEACAAAGARSLLTALAPQAG